MKKILLLLISVLFLVKVSAQTIGIGVQPSIIEVNLTPNKTEVPVQLKIFNEGDTDAKYKIVPENKLLNFIYYDCSLEPTSYWCKDKEYFVEAKGYKHIQVLFIRKTSTAETFQSNLILYVYVQPYYSNNNISLQVIPNVGITIKLKQIGTPTTSSTTTTTTTIKPFEPLNTTTSSTTTSVTTTTSSTTTTTPSFRPLTEEERRRIEEEIQSSSPELIETSTKGETWDYLKAVIIIVICVGCCIIVILGIKKYKEQQEIEKEQKPTKKSQSYFIPP